MSNTPENKSGMPERVLIDRSPVGLFIDGSGYTTGGIEFVRADLVHPAASCAAKMEKLRAWIKAQMAKCDAAAAADMSDQDTWLAAMRKDAFEETLDFLTAAEGKAPERRACMACASTGHLITQRGTINCPFCNPTEGETKETGT